MKNNEPLSTIDIGLIIAGWLGLMLMWYLVLSRYSSLPEIIPIHFNARGEVDGYGSRSFVWLLPVIGTVLFIGMSILTRYPMKMNYPVAITEENVQHHYRWAKRIIHYYNFAIAFAFSMIVYETIAAAQQKTLGLGIWLLLIHLAMFLGPVPFFLAKVFKRGGSGK